MSGYNQVAPVDAKGNPGRPTATTLRGLRVVGDTSFTVTLTQSPNAYAQKPVRQALTALREVTIRVMPGLHAQAAPTE